MRARYIFQGFDGKIYGEERNESPQVMGKVNAQLRRENSQGRWFLVSSLTPDEYNDRGNLRTAAILIQGMNSVTSAPIVTYLENDPQAMQDSINAANAGNGNWWAGKK